MSQLSTVAAPRPTTRTVARWMVSFVGFPLGGLSAMILVGRVDSMATALTGGLVTGAVLGAVQAWGMRADRRAGAMWLIATAVGLSVGLAIGATLVDFGTGLGDLVLQGAISGVAVGAAQSFVLFARVGSIAFMWPVYLGAAWAAGWAITTSVGVQVDDQFTVFGAAGAVTVTLLTAVLPVVLESRSTRTEKSHS
jgi:hypothetical protein